MSSHLNAWWADWISSARACLLWKITIWNPLVYLQKEAKSIQIQSSKLCDCKGEGPQAIDLLNVVDISSDEHHQKRRLVGQRQ